MPVANPRINGMLEKVKAAKAVADQALDEIDDHDVLVLLRLCIVRLQKKYTRKQMAGLALEHIGGIEAATTALADPE